MSRALLFAILCFTASFPSVSGSALLEPRYYTADCSGHLSDVTVTSVTCGGSTNCTFGDDVLVTGQVYIDNDIPRPMKVSVYRTLANVWRVGLTKVYSAEIDDVCSAGVITAYPDDQEDTCPGAGLYNFNVLYPAFGTRTSWYSGWSGYSFGMALHIKHEGGGRDFGECHMNVHVSRGDSLATNVTYVTVSALALVSVFAGVFAKRRKERLSLETQERTQESATNFELVQDSTPAIV